MEQDSPRTEVDWQATVADLVGLLRLEQLEVHLFRGESRDIGSAQVYGGQVLGQALSAAGYTVDDDRFVHSLHGYFLRPGDMRAPIIYEVDRQRDGRSFSNRRVVAIQHGRPILNLAASFQIEEDGAEHADSMPDVASPDSLIDIADDPDVDWDRLPARLRRFLVCERAFELRSVEPGWLKARKARPEKSFWVRARGELPDDRRLHEAMLAYMSDYGLVTTAMLPHGLSLLDPTLQVASIDHAMWFHRPFRCDEWLLYCCRSPSAAGSRGLARGQIFSRDGRLVSDTMQEGLIRQR